MSCTELDEQTKKPKPCLELFRRTVSTMFAFPWLVSTMFAPFSSHRTWTTWIIGRSGWCTTTKMSNVWLSKRNEVHLILSLTNGPRNRNHSRYGFLRRPFRRWVSTQFARLLSHKTRATCKVELSSVVVDNLVPRPRGALFAKRMWYHFRSLNVYCFNRWLSPPSPRKARQDKTTRASVNHPCPGSLTLPANHARPKGFFSPMMTTEWCLHTASRDLFDTIGRCSNEQPLIIVDFKLQPTQYYSNAWLFLFRTLANETKNIT